MAALRLPLPTEATTEEETNTGTDRAINPFIAMMAHENDPKSAKLFETLKPFCFSHLHVKGFSSKSIALKADVLWDRNILCV